MNLQTEWADLRVSNTNDTDARFKVSANVRREEDGSVSKISEGNVYTRDGNGDNMTPGSHLASFNNEYGALSITLTGDEKTWQDVTAEIHAFIAAAKTTD